MKKFRGVLDKVSSILDSKVLKPADKKSKAFDMLNAHYGKSYMIFRQLEDLQTLQKNYHHEVYIVLRDVLGDKHPVTNAQIKRKLKRLKTLHLENMLTIKDVMKREKYL
jgi:hypothetical protein|tara:strand:- start:87 stop:413 length:327 start_codon:yes stop_codon:yes gene_type:complete